MSTSISMPRKNARMTSPCFQLKAVIACVADMRRSSRYSLAAASPRDVDDAISSRACTFAISDDAVLAPSTSTCPAWLKMSVARYQLHEAFVL